jgi:hypothetical protein
MDFLGMMPVGDSLFRYKQDNSYENMINYLADDFHHPLIRFNLTIPKDRESIVRTANQMWHVKGEGGYWGKKVWSREETCDSVVMQSYPMGIHYFVDLIKKTTGEDGIELVGIYEQNHTFDIMGVMDEDLNLMGEPVEMERYGPVYDAIVGPRRYDTREIFQRDDEAKEDVIRKLLSNPNYCSLLPELFKGIIDADEGATFPAVDKEDVKYKRFEGWNLSGYLRKDPLISVNMPYFATDHLRGRVYNRAQVRQKWKRSEPEMPKLVDGQEEMYAADLMMGMFIGRKQFMQEQLTMYLEQKYDFRWYPHFPKDDRVVMSPPESELSILHWGISGDSMEHLRKGLPNVAKVFDGRWDEVRAVLKRYERPWTIRVGRPDMNYYEDTNSGFRAKFEIDHLTDDEMMQATQAATQIMLKGRLGLKNHITREEFDAYNPGR